MGFLERKLLEVKNLRKKFDGIEAVRGCSFNVKNGSITALIGPNGAGKTTVFNIISGLVKQDVGDIFFNGEFLSKFKPYKISSLGISRTFQLIRLFPQLTVMDNLLLAKTEASEGLFSSLFKRKFIKKKEEIAKERCLEFLRLVNMQDKANEFAMNLSYGQQKLIEIARSLASESKLFLLDEPVAGVNPVLREKLKEVMKRLQEKGKTILFIEHDMKFVLDVADEIIVLDHGEEIAIGKPEEIVNNQRVLEAYLGEKIKI